MSHFAHHSEENYLKTLFNLSARDIKKVNNIALAQALNLNPATVLEMVRKLVLKKLVEVKQDKTIALTEKGKKRALLTIRKHRLWEVFLVDKLRYKWNEVHELAEQLEHIESKDLIDRLEAFLDYPVSDPHGDPIPDKSGKLKISSTIPLSSGEKGKRYKVMSLAETNDAFLTYLEKLNIKPGMQLKVEDLHSYDQSCTVLIQKKPVQLSEKVAKNILVQPA
ncbi:MAG TPA: metal-dependent transcriptional regulator [Flavisolibacter sp.]|nr:metal-dependent transcriptional regulator [Flavisolibacter sp.]